MSGITIQVLCYPYQSENNTKEWKIKKKPHYAVMVCEGETLSLPSPLSLCSLLLIALLLKFTFPQSFILFNFPCFLRGFCLLNWIIQQDGVAPALGSPCMYG